MGINSGVFATTTGGPGLGYGLNGISDWSTQQPFLDVFKTARPWTGHEADQWGALSYSDMQAMGVLDDDGYLTAMPDGIDRVETFVLTEITEEATYTEGRYRLSYEGEGEVSVFGGTNLSYQDGEIWFDYTPSSTGLVAISINSTDPNGTGDYLRDFSLVKDDNIAAFEAGETFNPAFVANIEAAHTLRYMDWMNTNNSEVESWSDRPEVGDFTYANGVPVEVMVALANETGTEPWFNIPHNADDDYIREFASYVSENLDPDLRAHYEFSNEVWNFMFDQSLDSIADSQERFGEELPDGWMQEYGARSAEMASILDEVYAGTEDAHVKIIATHTAWPGLEASALVAPAYQALSPDNVAPHTQFDAYAVTGYFDGGLGNAKADTVLDWIEESRSRAEQSADDQGLTGQARADYLAAHEYDYATDLAIQELRDGSITGDPEGSLQDLQEQFEYHAAVADTYGLDLVMYEGGTHVVTTGAYVGNQELSEFFVHLNYSDGMGDLYNELLDGWVDAGGTLFNAFVDVARPSEFGSWGALRHLDDSTVRDDALDAFLEEYPRLDYEGPSPVDTPTPPVVPVDPVEEDAEDPAPTEPEVDETPDPVVIPDPQPEPEPAPDPAPAPVVTPYDPLLTQVRDTGQSDELTGTAGAELFTMTDDGGRLDVIEGFDPTQDELDLSQHGIYALSQLSITSSDDQQDLIVDFAGDRVILKGMWDAENNAPIPNETNLELAPMPEGADPEPPHIPYTGPETLPETLPETVPEILPETGIEDVPDTVVEETLVVEEAPIAEDVIVAEPAPIEPEPIEIIDQTPAPIVVEVAEPIEEQAEDAGDAPVSFWGFIGIDMWRDRIFNLQNATTDDIGQTAILATNDEPVIEPAAKVSAPEPISAAPLQEEPVGAQIMAAPANDTPETESYSDLYDALIRGLGARQTQEDQPSGQETSEDLVNEGSDAVSNASLMDEFFLDEGQSNQPSDDDDGDDNVFAGSFISFFDYDDLGM